MLNVTGGYTNFEKREIVDQFLYLLAEVPIISFNAVRNSLNNVYELNSILIPDPYLLDEQTWCETQQAVKTGMEKYPWETRKEIAFWRGSLAGQSEDYFEWKHVEHFWDP